MHICNQLKNHPINVSFLILSYLLHLEHSCYLITSQVFNFLSKYKKITKF